MAAQPDYPLLTASEFLEIDFGERKAELDNGVIRMMAGGTLRHSRIQTNIIAVLASRLRGTGCAPHGSDMAVRTRDISIRYPDVSVFCGREGGGNDCDKSARDPRIIFEVLSAGTARTDLRIKLDEYKELASVDSIIFVDTVTERVRVLQRTGPHGWQDDSPEEPTDVLLPTLDLVIPHDEIFARD